MAPAREGGGERRGRRCIKPAGSDAAARPRRLQRWPPTSQISGTKERQTVNGKAEDMRQGNKTPREDQQGRCRALGQRKGPATPLPECGRERCRGRDRAGAEECPGAAPAYRLMGWWAGNPPPGDDRGESESCKGRDGHPSGRREPCLPTFLSFLERVYSLFLDGNKWYCRLSAKGLNSKRQ